MTSPDPLFAYRRPGFKIEIFPNRIEVEEQGLRKKQHTILMRQVTAVENAGGLSKKLRVKTADGTTYEWMLGHKPGETTDEARSAIINLLGV